jgi:hypothetical protein
VPDSILSVWTVPLPAEQAGQALAHVARHPGARPAPAGEAPVTLLADRPLDLRAYAPRPFPEGSLHLRREATKEANRALYRCAEAAGFRPSAWEGFDETPPPADALARYTLHYTSASRASSGDAQRRLDFYVTAPDAEARAADFNGYFRALGLDGDLLVEVVEQQVRLRATGPGVLLVARRGPRPSQEDVRAAINAGRLYGRVAASGSRDGLLALTLEGFSEERFWSSLEAADAFIGLPVVRSEVWLWTKDVEEYDRLREWLGTEAGPWRMDFEAGTPLSPASLLAGPPQVSEAWVKAYDVRLDTGARIGVALELRDGAYRIEFTASIDDEPFRSGTSMEDVAGALIGDPDLIVWEAL